MLDWLAREVGNTAGGGGSSRRKGSGRSSLQRLSTQVEGRGAATTAVGGDVGRRQLKEPFAGGRAAGGGIEPGEAVCAQSALRGGGRRRTSVLDRLSPKVEIIDARQVASVGRTAGKHGPTAAENAAGVGVPAAAEDTGEGGPLSLGVGRLSRRPDTTRIKGGGSGSWCQKVAQCSSGITLGMGGLEARMQEGHSSDSGPLTASASKQRVSTTAGLSPIRGCWGPATPCWCHAMHNGP